MILIIHLFVFNLIGLVCSNFNTLAFIFIDEKAYKIIWREKQNNWINLKEFENGSTSSTKAQSKIKTKFDKSIISIRSTHNKCEAWLHTKESL